MFQEFDMEGPPFNPRQGGQEQERRQTEKQEGNLMDNLSSTQRKNILGKKNNFLNLFFHQIYVVLFS